MKRILYPLFCFIIFCLVCVSNSNAQTPVWAFNLGSTLGTVSTYGTDVGFSCKVGPNGNVCVTGKFIGSMDLDPGPGTYTVTSYGQSDIFVACYTPTGGFLWGFNVGSTFYDGALSIEVDVNNDVIIAGFIQGTFDIDPGPGVSMIPFAGGVAGVAEGDGFIAKFSSTGVYQWSKNLGDGTEFDYSEGLTSDLTGNIYVGGEFLGNMVLSGSVTLNSATGGNGYLIKYSPTGTLIWAHNIGEVATPTDCVVRSIKSNNGFVYICGVFRGTANFNWWGAPAILTALTGPTATDGFVAKYDTAGNFVWVTQMAGSGNGDEYGGLSLDASDNVYVAGWGNSASFVFNTASPGTSTIAAPGGGGNLDIVIAKYNSSGVYQWGHVIGGTGADMNRSAIDISGSELFISGGFQNTVDFDPSASIANLSSSGGQDMYLAKYDLNGNYLCAFSAGTAGFTDFGYGLTHDAAGFIYTTGQFGGAGTDFDPGFSTLPLSSNGGNDAYVAKYNPACISAECNVITLADSISLCVGDTITLPATMIGTNTVTSILWSPATGLSSTTILNPLLTASTSGYYHLDVTSIIPINMVANGDFSAGNTGFTSAYTYVTGAGSLFPASTYAITSDPNIEHPLAYSFFDHTVGTSAGRMMAINGASSPVNVWCQTISVTPNTDYDFSAWFSNWSSDTVTNLPMIQFEINGLPLGIGTFSFPGTPGLWTQFSSSWNSGISTSATICISDLQTAASGNDFAIDDITFRQLCKIKDSVYVNITIPDTTYVIHDTSICNASLPYMLTAPPGYVTYLWSTGSASPVSIGISGSGTYWVTAYGGCTYRSDTFHVGIFTSPTVNLGADTGFCLGNIYILSSPQPTGSSWLWSTGAITDSIHISATGSYTLTVTNGDGCSAYDVINVIVGPPPVVDLGPDTVSCDGHPILLISSVTYTTPAYYWHDFTTGPTFTATTTGTYWLQVTENGCSGADTVHVEIKYDTFTLYNVDTAICKGASLQVYATGDPNIHFLWLPTTGIPSPSLINPLITTDTSAMYVLYGYQDGCPVLMDSFYLDVQPIPDPFLGVNRRLCEYDTVRIVSSVDPGWYTHYTYSWSPSAFLDHTNLPSAVFTAGTTTNIKLTVTTPAGCMGIDSVMAVVYPGDFATISNDTIVCPHDTLHLTATGGIMYQWTPATYLNDANLASPLASPITTITYTMLATSADGCTDTLNVNVAVKPAAVIHMEDSVTIYPGESYQISPETNGTSFIWTPSGGLNGKYLVNPIASPEVSTRYIVNTVTEHGCKAMDSIYIFVDDNSLIGVPNAFTPGAGTNDKLYIIKRGLVNLKHFNIFNRWGNLVFTTTDLDAGWDGTYKGVPQPLGVFVYTIEAVTRTGKTITKSGNVTLLR
jgi:gliding motility-associated-like protein